MLLLFCVFLFFSIMNWIISIKIYNLQMHMLNLLFFCGNFNAKFIIVLYYEIMVYTAWLFYLLHFVLLCLLVFE